MRFLSKLALGILAITLLWYIVEPVYTYRFRLTIEADTPSGPRSGSSVIEVRSYDTNVGFIEMRGRHARVIGEAAFADLGQGKNVIALLAGGEHAQGVDLFRELVRLVFEDELKPHGYSLAAMANLRGKKRIAPHLIPTLATFSNLKDPKTARIVAPDAFDGAFGAGYTFRQATLEMVPAGWWPLNTIGITGTPITRGIEKKLLWWDQPGRPAVAAWKALVADNVVGSIGPETLFKE
ncbi:MAG: hypothetical protein ABL901_20615 [Hyphomicrobiaceae bacterium]